MVSAIQSGAVPLSDLDGMVHRILESMFRFGVYDVPASGNLSSVVTNLDHALFTRDAAAQGIVLLKNSGGLLPLKTSTVRSIAIIGSVASSSPISTGGGSAGVVLPYNITPRVGIGNRAGAINVSYNSGSSFSSAAALAASCDVAIVCVGERTSEGSDRASLSLPNNQDGLINAVAAANSHTIVVLYTSGATLMPWASQVAGILVAWYPGQENGNSLASVLFGDVNPSGKLPVTFPVLSSQVPANTASQFPGVNGHTIYSEGLQIGYRWYDANNISPLYCFGHGLSYTTFGYKNLTLSPVSASGQVQVGFDVTNTGTRSGAEVAQLYLGFPAAANEPPRLLKGFQKVFLEQGQTKHLVLNLNWEDLANWDTLARGWIVTPGTFQVMVGASSRDIRLTGSFAIGSIPSSDLVNAALHQPVTVSSPANGSAAVDGDPKTAWSSLSTGPQGIAVDLGVIRDLSRVRLQWNTNYARSYSIQISSNGTTYASIYSTINSSGGIDEVLVSGRGRFVRILATEQGVPGTGYSLSELEVYSLPQRPYGETVPNLPGIIEAENYDAGGQKVAYFNPTVGNSGGAYRTDDVGIEPTTDDGGGYDVGWLNAGQWLEYTVNLPDPETVYSIKMRVASLSSGGQVRVRLDGAVLGTISIPNTGGWQNWKTVSLPYVPISGATGSRALRLEILSGGFNLNWIAVTRAAFCSTTNIALNQPVTASSVQDIYPASSAVDGDPRSRWAAQSSDTQWITVDLGTNYSLARVRLNWEAAFAKGYKLQLSGDNLTWTDVYVTTNNYSVINDLAVSGNARYVRVFTTKRGTVYGNSLWDFEVYPALSPSFVVQPTSQITAAGNALTLSALATDTAPMSYQWYHENTPLTGATGSDLVLVNVQAVDAGNYWVLASNSLCSLASSIAEITLYTPINGILGMDSAMNYSASSGFTGNQGFGFGQWVVMTPGGGSYISGDNPPRFCIWNGVANGQSTAFRIFNTPLMAGGSFSVQLQMGYLDSSSNQNGIQLLDANGNVRFSYWHQGGDIAHGHYFDGTGTNIAVGFAYDFGKLDQITFTLKSATDFTFTNNATGATLNGKLAPGGTITGVNFFRLNGATTPGNGQDFKFSNLSLTMRPVSSSVSLAKKNQGQRLRLGVAPGYIYRIQRATNVVGPWGDVGSLIGAMGGFSEFIDTNPPLPRSFYRTVTP